MRKLPVIVFAFLFSASAFSQTTNKQIKIPNRAADHLMIQLGHNFWNGTADTVTGFIKGFNRSANAYIMIDKPFKNSPKFSAGIGIGVGTSNIYFKNMEVKIGATKTRLPFVRTDTGNHYKKYKLATAFLEIPVELRFMVHPETPNKSFKGAVGFKVGTLLSAHTKGKGLETAGGTKLNGSAVKESSKSYFNTSRISLTARAGYGIFSLYGAYGFTNIFKDGVAPVTRLGQIGITISGL